MLLFEWMSLVDVVRAEFLRARNFDYVRGEGARRRRSDDYRAARSAQRDGVDPDFLPFIMNASIATLTALDFLGFGLRPVASLGELVAQARPISKHPGSADVFLTLACC